jgi:hypothetical protein
LQFDNACTLCHNALTNGCRFPALAAEERAGADLRPWPPLLNTASSNMKKAALLIGGAAFAVI